MLADLPDNNHLVPFLVLPFSPTSVFFKVNPALKPSSCRCHSSTPVPFTGESSPERSGQVLSQVQILHGDLCQRVSAGSVLSLFIHLWAGRRNVCAQICTCVQVRTALRSNPTGHSQLGSSQEAAVGWDEGRQQHSPSTAAASGPASGEPEPVTEISANQTYFQSHFSPKNLNFTFLRLPQRSETFKTRQNVFLITAVYSTTEERKPSLEIDAHRSRLHTPYSSNGVHYFQNKSRFLCFFIHGLAFKTAVWHGLSCQFSSFIQGLFVLK